MESSLAVRIIHIVLEPLTILKHNDLKKGLSHSWFKYQLERRLPLFQKRLKPLQIEDLQGFL